MPRKRSHSGRTTSGTGSRTAGCLFTVFFGGAFAVAGTGLFIFFTVLPLWNIIDARGWTATPCTITHAQVQSHSDSDGTTYSIDIRYTYQVNGKTYKNDTYRFAPPGSSSGYNGKRRAVDAHPVGSKQTCFVDPDDPARSVIQRGPTAALWWGLFPIPFMAVGLGVLYAGLTGRINFNARGSASGWRPAGMDAGSSGAQNTAGQMPTSIDTELSWTDGDGDVPIVLDPAKARKTGFLGITFFAILWNGILSAIAYGVFSSAFTNGGLAFVPVLFVTPFLLVGLVLIGVSVRKAMLVFAPHIVVELGRDTLPLGGSTLLRWHVADARKRIERVQIKLVGEEQATYRRGTDTVTDTMTFCEKWLVGDDADFAEHAETPMPQDHGDIVLMIPSDTMHTFSANNNKIIWKLVVRAVVARWPDPKDEHEITVLPMPISRS